MKTKASTNLEELIQQVKNRLKECSYSEHAQKSYSIYFNAIKKYAVSKGIGEYNEQLGIDFLKERYNYPFKKQGRLCTTIQNAARCVELITSMYTTGDISRRKKHKTKKTLKNTSFQETVGKYNDIIRNSYDNQGNIHHRMNTVYEFLEYITDCGLESFAMLCANHISGFLSTFINLSRGSRKTKLSHIRLFLRYLYSEKHTPLDLSLAIPALRLGGYTYVPKPFTTEETEQFLAAIDRTKPYGKRDYAIVKLISRLGIRSGDARLLKFEHINWEKSLLTFRQGKTGNIIELPLPEDVGLCIIEYLRDGRPTSNSEYIFLRHSAPFEPLAGLSDICRRYLKENNIETKRNKGLHSFRHALASRLLDEDVPPETIAQILGHVNNATVGQYLHIDFKRLRLCAIDPEEVFCGE